MSEVSLEEVKALIASGLEDEDLQTIIDREEGRLAARLGTPLVGGVEDVVLTPTRRSDPLLLSRLPDPESVVVEEDGSPVDVIVSGATVTRASGSWAVNPSLSYEFADVDEVHGVVIDLVRLALTESPYSQEGTEGHNYSRSTSVDRQRAQLIATLDPHRGKPASVPM